MNDGKQIDLSDTNLMNFGTELEFKIKKAAAEQEDAWKVVGKELGVLVWRIEKFKVVEWPKEEYGKFYDGDSYIVLHTYQKEDKGAFKYHAHMWVGKHTTKDEAGTAAYKTVEVDDFLGRSAILYRETQGNESDLFLSYFNQKIHILHGGVESGFKKKHSDIFENRLYRIYFKNKVTKVIEVKMICSSLNSRDAFILDAGKFIYKWVGKSASSFEKFKAGEVALHLDDSRGSTPKIIELEQGNDDNEDFWKLLGGKGDISEPEQELDHNLLKGGKRLVKISDASDKLETILIAENENVKRDLFKSEDVFFLIHGAELSIWIGSKSSRVEKKHAFPFAIKYLSDNKLPINCLIACYQEGHADDHFAKIF